MSDVVQFPERPRDPLFGTFSYHAVVVEGRQIPLLTGSYDGPNTVLIVDERFSISVPNDLAYQVAWLLAQAIAVASGYTHLGAQSKEQPFAPLVAGLPSDFVRP